MLHQQQQQQQVIPRAGSKINKLRIEGIRSFSHKDAEIIEFSTPLTLIVGYNGSGKTTIIECLKYATTGELPPNSKGGAFVRDPELVGATEVKGQVRLAFRGANQSKMVICRSIQLTVKKTTRTFKTLDGNLATYKNGERSSVSKRVAELDKLMPDYLGVSKAVLDMVIFCHQDESLWPMSEPAQLKKRFDEIFEALKYTKALDNIKAVRKKTGEDLKVLRAKESSLKQIKTLGDKAERDSRALSADVTQLKADIRDLQEKAKDARAEWQAATKQAAEYDRVVNSLARKKEDEHKQMSWIQKLRDNLIERNESNEWLQSEVDQFEQRVIIHEQHKGELVKQHDTLGRTLQEGNEKLRKKENEAGGYEEQKRHHEQQIKDRQLLVKDSSQRHNITGYDYDLDDMQINEYIQKITRLSRDQTTAIEKVRRETEQEMQEAQKMLSDLGERRSAVNESRDSARQQITTNESRITASQIDLDKIEMDEGGKAALEDDIEDMETRLGKAKVDDRNASWEKKIQDNNAQLSALDEESKQLNRDLLQASRQARDFASLDLLNKSLKESQRKLDTMRGVHKDRLDALVEKGWQPSRLDTAFQTALNQKTREVKDAEHKRDLEIRSLEQADYKLNSVRADLKQGFTNLEKCAKTIRDYVESEPEDYETAMTDLQEGRDTRKADVDGFGHQREFYEKAIKKARKDNHCNMCFRSFHGANEQEAFLKRIENIISKQSLKAVKEELIDLEELLQKGKEAGPSHDMWVRLSKSEIPRLQADKKELEKQREQLIEKIEDNQRIVDHHGEAKKDLDSLAKPVAEIVKYTEEITRFSAQLQGLSAKQKDSGMVRSTEQVEEQLEQINSRVQEMRKMALKLATDEKRTREHISTLELDLSKARNNLSLASHQLEKRAGISQQITELRVSNQAHREAVHRLAEQLRDLAPEIAEAEAKRADVKQRGFEKEASLQKETSELTASINKLKLAEQNIQAYIEGGGRTKLTRCRREMETIQQQNHQTEEEQKRVIDKINTISEDLRNQRDTKRTIEDTLSYRAGLKDLETLRSEIAKLSDQNAEADQEHWTTQSNRWQAKYNALSTDMTSKLGAARAKDDALRKNIADWETEFKTAAQDYKKAHIEVEATKAAVEDLGRYAGALDKAIIKYHSIKMEEVNRIIDELWKKTYQGTDVDTILIRSDDENAKGNRSYNYRVCMVKQDAEMDMRGRCSAGQKVLASIIIRLALAECFGINCGLIALDEPTTNLDRDNIRSLAGSLHDIIQARQHQANFQLIVITHDEEFLKFMKCPEFTDTYWRISRNVDQTSIIEKQSIAQVM